MMPQDNQNFRSKAGSRNLIALLSGILLAYGLSLGKMTDQQTIIGFLDLLGNWNPQFLFVLLGALFIYIPAFLISKKMSRPLFDSKKHLPKGKDLSQEIIWGSTLFGVGWALAGFCPGTGLVSAMNGNWAAVAFSIAMTVGMAIHHFYKQFFSETDF